MGLKKRLTYKVGARHRKKKPWRRIREILTEAREYARVGRIESLVEDTQDERGENREELLWNAFSDSERYYRPSYFDHIRRATRAEDLYGGTDFVAMSAFGDEVKIDVKASICGAKKQVAENLEKGRYIWVLVITPTMTNREIREKVFDVVWRQVYGRKHKERRLPRPFV